MRVKPIIDDLRAEATRPPPFFSVFFEKGNSWGGGARRIGQTSAIREIKKLGDGPGSLQPCFLVVQVVADRRLAGDSRIAKLSMDLGSNSAIGLPERERRKTYLLHTRPV